MAVIAKDVAKFPKDAPTELLLSKHKDFIADYGKHDPNYEYEMAEFLRISGVYWGYTAMCLMHGTERMDRQEVPYKLSDAKRVSSLYHNHNF